eukprot:scaffold2261_cov405-Prasinococcus_capsulatus_cf.AAC.18
MAPPAKRSFARCERRGSLAARMYIRTQAGKQRTHMRRQRRARAALVWRGCPARRGAGARRLRRRAESRHLREVPALPARSSIGRRAGGCRDTRST